MVGTGLQLIVPAGITGSIGCSLVERLVLTSARTFLSPVSMPDKDEDREQIVLEGWCNAIEAVRASLRDYPHGGGDIVIMREVERICAEAVAKSKTANKTKENE